MTLFTAQHNLRAAHAVVKDLESTATLAWEELIYAKSILIVKEAQESDALAAENTATVADALDCADVARDAKTVADAARRQVADKQNIYDVINGQLAQARVPLAQAAEELLDAETEIVAAEAEQLLAQLAVVAEKLRHRLPDELNTPINKLREPSARVSQVLQRLRAITHDDLNTPINELRQGGIVSQYRARRHAALIATGDPEVADVVDESESAAA